MDNVFKMIRRQVIDIIFAIGALFGLVLYLIDLSRGGDSVNYTSALILVFGYAINNIINKVRILRNEQLKQKQDG